MGRFLLRLVLVVAFNPGAWLVLAGGLGALGVLAVERGWIETSVHAALEDAPPAALHDTVYVQRELDRLYLLAAATAGLGLLLVLLGFLRRLRSVVGRVLLWGAGLSFLTGMGGFLAPALGFIRQPQPTRYLELAELQRGVTVLGLPAGDWPALGGAASGVFLLFAIARGLLWRL